MDLEQLKQDWGKMSGPQKANAELDQMTHLVKHPALRRVRIRLMIEGGLILAFISLYYTALDGDQKPWWVNLMLILAACIYLGHHVFNWWMLRQAGQGNTLIDSLRHTESRLRQLQISSLVISAFWGFSLIGFLMYPRNLMDLPTPWIIGVIVTLGGLLGLSFMIWENKIKQIRSIRQEWAD